LLETAKEIDLSYQLEILVSGGTDAGAIHTTREGVPSGVVSIPTRHLHSPSEMVDMNDVEGAVKLLTATLEKDCSGLVG